ncbi:MAG: hypothetical protein GY797_13550 [Deltaproteobacteria bacterium]|nr:hypothetical protein [Deltaproteobacteria bacterium]
MEIIVQIIGQLKEVSFIIGLIFIGSLLGGIYFYHFTEGQMSNIFEEQPKRLLYIAFIMSLTFAVISTIVDFLILLLLIQDNAVDVKQLFIVNVIQFLLIIIIGTPFAWFGYRLAIPLARKIFGKK